MLDLVLQILQLTFLKMHRNGKLCFGVRLYEPELLTYPDSALGIVFSDWLRKRTIPTRSSWATAIPGHYFPNFPNGIRMRSQIAGRRPLPGAQLNLVLSAVGTLQTS